MKKILGSARGEIRSETIKMCNGDNCARGGIHAMARDRKASRPLCKFFLGGYCKDGEDCWFNHETLVRKIRFCYRRNNCPFGDGCGYRHCYCGEELTIFELAALGEHACGEENQSSRSEDRSLSDEVQVPNKPADSREEEEEEVKSDSGAQEKKKKKKKPTQKKKKNKKKKVGARLSVVFRRFEDKGAAAEEAAQEEDQEEVRKFEDKGAAAEEAAQEEDQEEVRKSEAVQEPTEKEETKVAAGEQKDQSQGELGQKQAAQLEKQDEAREEQVEDQGEAEMTPEEEAGLLIQWFGTWARGGGEDARSALYPTVLKLTRAKPELKEHVFHQVWMK